jgi:hypothetical protein
MLNLDCIEKKQNIKFPEEYKQLYQSNFVTLNDRMEINTKEDIFRIRKFLSATEISDILEEFYDFLGYDIIPVAEIDYGDYICLYYKEDAEEPSIIYWDYELALENAEEGISYLYSNAHEFITDITRL